MNLLTEMFSLQFIRTAFLVGILVSICASLLGVTLVLKRYSMIGDGLSHVGFGALSIALAFNLAPLEVSTPIVILSAFLLLRLSENSKIKGDAAIALISSSALAVGVIVTAVTRGMNLDVCNFMFGSIIVIPRADLYLSVGLSVVVLVLYVMFYNKIFAITFDEGFAKATGTAAGAYKMLIAFLTAVTVVIGMRIMGTLLISSLIIFPALTSMRVCKSFKSVVITSIIISAVCFYFGMLASYQLRLPVGASIVACNIITFVGFSAVGLILRRN